MERVAANGQTTERLEIQGLLSEAKSLHERMASILNVQRAAPDFSPPASFRASSQCFNEEFVPPSSNWDALFRRGRELDEKLRRYRFDLPSPLPVRTHESEDGISEDDKNIDKENDSKIHEDARPIPSVSRPMKEDELLKPTIRPVVRFEPGMMPFKHDPVRRYELYKQEWAKFPAPGENKRLDLRWKIREYMLRIDLPSDLISRGRSQ